MGCCDKTRRLLAKGGQIGLTYADWARGRKCAATHDRVRVCQKCDRRHWIGSSLWCKECWCFIPVKARRAENRCPLGRWDHLPKT